MKEQKIFSNIGWKLFMALVLQIIIMFVVTLILQMVFISQGRGEMVSTNVSTLIGVMALDLIAWPLVGSLLKKLPRDSRNMNRMPLIQILMNITIAIAIMYTGNLIGQIVNYGLTSMTGSQQINVAENLIGAGGMTWQLLFICLIGPIMEEFIFRKCIIDIMRPFGTKAAIFTSAILFAIVHGNISQFFYALGLGVFFGYIYAKTNNVIYTMIIHCFTNLFSGILANMYGTNTIFLIVYLLVVLLGIASLIYLVTKDKAKISESLKRENKVSYKRIWLNPGMLTFTIVCIMQILISVIGQAMI